MKYILQDLTLHYLVKGIQLRCQLHGSSDILHKMLNRFLVEGRNTFQLRCHLISDGSSVFVIDASANDRQWYGRSYEQNNHNMLAQAAVRIFSLFGHPMPPCRQETRTTFTY